MPEQKPHPIVVRCAPIFAQKVHKEWPAADSVAPINYAGGLTTVAENLTKFLDERQQNPLQAIQHPRVYYSLSETSTHYFVIYMVYHVFDWWKRLTPRTLYDLIRDRVDEHAHDLEGALVVVRKAPKPMVDAIVTVAHNNFYLYSQPLKPTEEGKDSKAIEIPSLAIVKFNESVDGNIWVDKGSQRIKLYIESRGHGMYGDHSRWGGGDAVWYYRPVGETGNPAALNVKAEDVTDTIDYHLEDIFAKDGLWAHRFDDQVFRQKKTGQWALVCYKQLTKGQLQPGSANPSWSWNDHNDTSPLGEIATDPAHFILRYAQGWGPVSTHYIANPYMEI